MIKKDYLERLQEIDAFEKGLRSDMPVWNKVEEFKDQL